VFESVVAVRRPRNRSFGLRDTIYEAGVSGRLEQWQPHVFVLFESDSDLLSDVHVGRVAVDDVRGEVDPGIPG
jgi:hypothetical protein